MIQKNATFKFLFRKPHQVVCSSAQYSTQLMSNDDNLILQTDDEERNSTTEKETLRKLNEWEDRVIENKIETTIFDVRRDVRITFSNNN